jgi:replication initiation protein RepC
METGHVTTPFGQRPMTLAQARGQMGAADIKPGRSIDKWRVLRDICDARTRLKLRDRALAVLSALLSFHPGVDLSAGDNLIVFPSNVLLSSRANGIAGTTLRENLAVLVQAGIIHRQDSPNGKRYARKSGAGRIEVAYGFDLTPLIARAGEFESLAKEVAAERRQVSILRERITLLRRDIRKLISAAIDEQADGDWRALETDYITLMAGCSRARSIECLIEVESSLADFKQMVLSTLKYQWKNEKSDANASDIRQHIQNQNTESLLESESCSGKEQNRKAERELPSRLDTSVSNEGDSAEKIESSDPYPKLLPLGMILRCCPEILSYGPKGRIENWRDLITAAVVVRSMLGVSSSAYEEACAAIGPENTAAVVGYILQKAENIRSPGGYLRELTRKARRGEFSLVSMVMSLKSRSAP